MMNRSRILLSALIGTLAIGCPGAQTNNPPPQTPEAPAADHKKEPVVVRESKTGLGFRLSEGEDNGDENGAKPAKTTPLAAKDAKALFDRLPPMKGDADDQKEFALRDKSIPAPRPGETIKETFPPPVPQGAPPAVVSGPLKVVRHEPEGEVSLAPYLTVTFNAPMVPITSHDDLSKIPVPIKLAPEPPGTWKWIGTQTAMFQPQKRFPMSTDYTYDIDAGTKSILGAALVDAQHFKFQTPTLKMGEHGPGGSSVKLNPLIYARFDQDIDPNAILSAMNVKQNGKDIKVRFATQEEMDADETVTYFLEKRDDDAPVSLGIGDYHRSAGGQYSGNAAKGRMIVVTPVDKLQTAASVEVKFPKGTPSAEGPKTTTTDQSYAFRTYGPLRAVAHRCDDCNPFSSFSIEFTNSLELSKFDKSWVKVTPEIPDMKTVVSGDYLVISGRKKGRTKYTVTISNALTDVFDQTLGQDDTASFDVGPADSVLFAENTQMTVADPGAHSTLPVYSVNDPTLHVRLYSVKPEEYAEYISWRQEWDWNGKLGKVPGKLVFDKIIKTEKKPDELTESAIDLAPALKDGVGQVLAIVETTRREREPYMKEWVREWVQVTHIGLDAIGDSTQTLSWTTSLASGAPLEGVIVGEGSGTATSGPDGIAKFDATNGIVIAKKASDTTFLPSGVSHMNWRPSPTRFFTFDDRKMYKPGEDVHVKGFVRNVGYDKGGDVTLLNDSAKRVVHWVAHDPRGAELSKGDANMDALGGFDFLVKTPNNANTGYASVSLEIAGVQNGSHSFQIEEFRRPEFEVHASTSGGPNFVGEHATATVDAKYYSGGGLPNADVTWSVSRTDGSFSPPNREQYVFGKHDYSSFYGYGSRKKGKRADRTNETWTGHTNPQGAHHMRVDFDSLDPAYPMLLNLNASVMDVNRQAWAAQTTMLVHPSSLYVGIKLDKSFVNAGESIQADTIAVDLDGKAVSGKNVTVKAARIDWVQSATGYEEKEVDEQTCSVVSGADAVRCSLPAKKGGRYRLTGIVEDEFHRKSQTTTSVWVMDRDSPPSRDLKADAVELVTDKKTYAPGDTAELLVVAPFAPAEGVLVLARQGVMSTERFTMSSRMQTLKVKIDGNLTPNVHAYVLLAGQAAREDESGTPNESLPKRPAYARGTISLAIPPVERTLKVSAVPREKAVEPAGRTTVDIDVKDSKGAPVAGAEVAVIVVDESILALSGYQLPDPVAAFYPTRQSGIAEEGSRQFVTLAKPSDAQVQQGLRRAEESKDKGGEGIGLGNIGTLGHGAGQGFGNGRGMTGGGPPPPPMRAMDAAPAPGAPMASAAAMKRAMAKPMATATAAAEIADERSVGGMAKTPIAVRTDFSALAVFEPAKMTDAKGHIEVPVKLPDSLTRYRVMAIAVAHDNLFGSEESTITARLPLMIRPSAPRFLNFGDKFDFPVVLQNQTDKPMTVAVGIRALNASVGDQNAKAVDVPANDRVEVRFLAAAEKPGKARFQVGAAAGNFADASDVVLPVWTPATTEAFATYGVIDKGAIAQPVQMPSNVVTQFGGLEVTTSSTAMQGLTDAVLYLVHYPYECNEQISSRMLAISSLKDVLAAFKSKELPPPAEMEASMVTDLDKLKTRQKWDGGWGFWWGEEWPYLTIHIAHAIVRAEEKGYKADAQMKQRALGYLRSIEGHIPYWYGPEAKNAIIAYALYVRRLMKDPDPARARRLITEMGGVDKAEITSLGWIWPTISEDKNSAGENAKIRRVVGNRITETAGAAHFVTSYGDGDYLLLHSDRRADAVLLEALMIDQPESDIIPKLVKGLLAHRKAGHWTSTQENAFVLLALDKYFEKYENVTPDFVARVWLGDKFAGEHTFKGRSTDYAEIDVPMQFIADMKEGNLTLGKEGAGRLYFRIGMQYAPTDLRPPPMDQGFTVTRTYEWVDDDGDVKKDADGVWHFKAGKKVRARVTMVAPSRRYHVALVDPIPAGIEPMNPALAVTGTIPQDPNASKSADRYWYWHSTWYEHQNIRDERVEAFSSLVWEGVHEYVYTARATTPGTFVVPPPKAEEMYSPEVFGRGAGDKVIVE